MKSLSAGTLSHLASDSTSFTVCWRIIRKDNIVKGFTSNVEDIIWTDPADSIAYTFKASTGIIPTNVQVSAGKGVDNMEVFGILNSIDISEQDLLNGLYDDAKIEVFLLNYKDVTQDRIILVQGFLGEVRIGRKSYNAEIRSLMQRATQMIGITCSPLCRVKELGDAECTKNLSTFTFSGTVNSVSSRSIFTTSSVGIIGKPAFYFAYGKLTWTSGQNSGKSIEVRSHDISSPMQITLGEIMPFPITAGDAFTIIAGCDRRLESCRDKFANVVNFRGEPYVPGAEGVLKITSI